MQDTWFSRELPVLTAVVEAFEDLHGVIPNTAYIAQKTGLEVQDVGKSLLALDGEYLVLQPTMSGGDPAPWFVTKVFTNARREVGQWPSAETLIDRLSATLEQMASETNEPQTKGKLQQAAAALGGLAKNITVEITTKMLEHQMGIS